MDLLQLRPHRPDADLAHPPRRDGDRAGDLRRAKRLVLPPLAGRPLAGRPVVRDRRGRPPAGQGRHAAPPARGRRAGPGARAPLRRPGHDQRALLVAGQPAGRVHELRPWRSRTRTAVNSSRSVSYWYPSGEPSSTTSRPSDAPSYVMGRTPKGCAPMVDSTWRRRSSPTGTGTVQLVSELRASGRSARSKRAIVWPPGPGS